MKILKNDKRYLGAPLDDYYINLDLESNKGLYKNHIKEFSVNEVDVFDSERNKCNKYLFYGKMEILSEMNETPYIELGFISGYEIEYGIIVKEIKNGGIVISDVSQFSEDDKILYWDSINKREKLTKVTSIQRYDDKYILFLDILNPQLDDIITPSQFIADRFYEKLSDKFNIFKSGFSINIFGDPIYQFLGMEDIIVDKTDIFNYPVTSVFYKMKKQSSETIKGIKFRKLMDSREYKHVDNPVDGKTTNPNRVDRVLFDLNEFNITKLHDYKFIDGVYESILHFEQEIRERGDVVEDDYGNIVETPQYATFFMDNEVFFKQILNKSDVNINSQFDFPYLNDLHYVYSDFIYIKNNTRTIIPTNVVNVSDILIDDYESESLVNTNKERLC